MSEKIIRNSARCAHCPVELESVHRHDFKTHECVAAGKISHTYDPELKKNVPAYPLFAVDGGKEYVRRVGYASDFIETSVFE